MDKLTQKVLRELLIGRTAYLGRLIHHTRIERLKDIFRNDINKLEKLIKEVEGVKINEG